jgi:hypothetical protein
LFRKKYNFVGPAYLFMDDGEKKLPTKIADTLPDGSEVFM